MIPRYRDMYTALQPLAELEQSSIEIEDDHLTTNGSNCNVVIITLMHISYSSTTHIRLITSSLPNSTSRLNNDNSMCGTQPKSVDLSQGPGMNHVYSLHTQPNSNSTPPPPSFSNYKRRPPGHGRAADNGARSGCRSALLAVSLSRSRLHEPLEM
jgi:hypothetical protein